MSDKTTFLQYRIHVVQPALAVLNLPGGEAAELIVVGTAAQETRLERFAQTPSGPARCFLQIEQPTFDDLFDNFLDHRPDLRDLALGMAVPHYDLFDQLTWNLRFAAAIARLIYYRAPGPLPAASDIEGLAAYYKKFWNTSGGAATPEEFVRNFHALVAS